VTALVVRYTLVSEVLHTIPGSFFYSRKGFTMKQVCAHASERGFTNIIVLNETRKTPCSLVMSHLPAGETAPPCARAFNRTSSSTATRSILIRGNATQILF
jgi:hypothetical protein